MQLRRGLGEAANELTEQGKVDCGSSEVSRVHVRPLLSAYWGVKCVWLYLLPSRTHQSNFIGLGRGP